MKVIWLNDSLVLRAENGEEKKALVVVFKGLGPDDTQDTHSSEEVGATTPISVGQLSS
jgi:hypothetical protein